ncbi:MAG: (2Fe-2S) ferredoxin domain-containing protein [bacterium]
MDINQLKKMRDEVKRDLDLRSGEHPYRITISMGTVGIAAGAREVMKAVIDELAKHEIDDVPVTITGTLGFDDQEVVMRVESAEGEQVTYARLDAEKARKIVREHVDGGKRVKEFVVGMADHSATSEERES